MSLKKIMTVVLTVIMMFSLGACSNKNDEKEDSVLMKYAKEALDNRLIRLDYSSDNYWYQTGNKYDENKIDVFYALFNRQ